MSLEWIQQASARCRGGGNRLIGGFAGRSEGAIAYALTDENDLLRFDTAAPEDILSGGVITGILSGAGFHRHRLPPGRRPALRRPRFGGVFRINPTTRVATFVSNLVADPTDMTSPFPACRAHASASTSTRSPTACGSSAIPSRTCGSTSTPV